MRIALCYYSVSNFIFDCFMQCNYMATGVPNVDPVPDQGRNKIPEGVIHGWVWCWKFISLGAIVTTRDQSHGHCGHSCGIWFPLHVTRSLEDCESEGGKLGLREGRGGLKVRYALQLFTPSPNLPSYCTHPSLPTLFIETQ